MPSGRYNDMSQNIMEMPDLIIFGCLSHISVKSDEKNWFSQN